MILIEKAKTSHKCMICNENIKLGESYLQIVKNSGGGMAIFGIHADHIANDKKNLQNLSRSRIKIINNICKSATELIKTGSTLQDAIKESKKINNWSMWI